MPRDRQLTSINLINGQQLVSPALDIEPGTTICEIQANVSSWPVNANVRVRLEFSKDNGSTWPEFVQTQFVGNSRIDRATGLPTSIFYVGRKLPNGCTHFRLAIIANRNGISITPTMREI